MIGLTVAAEDSETEFWGIAVGDLQEDIVITDNAITGTLKYVADYSAAGFEEGGNFIALKVSSSQNVDGVTYTCTIMDEDGSSRSVTLDNDRNIVIRIADKDSQQIVMTAEKDGYGTDVTVLSLAGLTCNTE